ncbi:MAG: hydrogenase iron-sulfur subunit [Caldilineales bacterium]|nr:hydrogenase iron-sulfur subunit [Caldilineales bacterium]MCW5858710.1 hydrogenase iron-sulfur subunit [Caldilineales bacterium]
MATNNEQFEPTIIGFTCNWCSYRAADLAGTSRTKYPPNVRLIRLMCSGRLDPTFVLKALSLGADGVLITGCHPGECHYLEQNYKALRRYALLKRMLAQFGVEPERVKLVWASAAEGVRLAHEITEMVESVRALGPLNWPGVVASEQPAHEPAQASVTQRLPSPAEVPQEAAA